MKVIIVEDEALAAKRLKKMILDHDSSIEVLAELESVEESVEWFRNNPSPDLIFLDIHLEDDLSFAIFDKVEVKSPIIFTTAFDEYAIKAFKLKSIDYLLKPVVQEELVNALNKYKEMIGNQEPHPDMQSLFEMLVQKTRPYKERYSVAFGQKIKTFSVNEIAYFVTIDGSTQAVLRDKRSYPLDQSLDKLSNEVDPNRFFRINRKMLVSLEAIAQVHIFPKSRLKLEITPDPGEDVFVSLDKVTPFKTWLGAK